MQIRFFTRLRLVYLVGLLPGVAAAQDLVEHARSGDLAELMAALPEGSEPEPEKLNQPMFFASERGHDEVVAFLLSVGADPDSATDFGTSLGIAARKNHTGIVAALLAAGADPGLPGGEDGRMPLHHAAERGAIESARLLLDYGADVNAVTTHSEWPAIHLAASKDRTEMVDFLREMGAGPVPVDALRPGELDSADTEQGRLIAIECGGCHGITPGDTEWRQFSAPNLVGIVDRPKASVEDFPYSEAMQAQSGRWTPEELNIFLADPVNVVPGTDMGRGGLPERAARVSIIAYLARLAP